MPASMRVTAEINNIIGGNGMVDLTEGFVALAGATGLAAFTKKIGLWPKFTAVEKTEVEMLDEQMPGGMWLRIQHFAPAAIMSGRKLRWSHKPWSVGTEAGDLLVTTPMLDEETGELV